MIREQTHQELFQMGAQVFPFAKAAMERDLSLEVRYRLTTIMKQFRIRPADDPKIPAYIERAEQAIARGKFGAARIYFLMAARRSSGEARQVLQHKAAELAASHRQSQ